MALVTTETTGFLLAGRYRLERRIGGTKTRIWSARDELLLRTVVVKILDDTLPPYFTAATQALAKIAHPGIVIINDVGENDSSLYLVMELLDGVDLAARLRDGPLPWREAARVCADVAGALGAAHYSGMYHGDLRPENIILTETGTKVCGFGSVAAGGAMDRYAPPEAEPSLAGDVYALGMILSETLMGKIGVNVALPADVPDDVARWCIRAVAADPAARPSAKELAHELTQAAAATDLPEPVPALADLPDPPVRPDPPGQDDTLFFASPPPGQEEETPPLRRGGRRPLLLAGALATVLAASGTGILAIVPADSVSGRVKMPSMDNAMPMTSATATAKPPVAVTPARPPTLKTNRPEAAPTSAQPRAGATDQPVTLPDRIGTAVVLDRLQRAINAGTKSGDIRGDVGLDLSNQVKTLRKTKQADLPAKVAAFQLKVATRLREHALSQREAILLDDIAAELIA
jgi:serine/threonine-protein kinase